MQIYQSAQITDKLNRINSKALEYFLSNYYNIKLLNQFSTINTRVLIHLILNIMFLELITIKIYLNSNIYFII